MKNTKKKQKRHLNPAIKKALENIAYLIIAIILAVGLIAMLFIASYQKIGNYNEMRYSEIQK